MLTAEQMTDELTTRLPEIERRLAWLRERELKGTGHGPDELRRMVHDVTERVAELRAVLGLPPASEKPVFDASLWS